MNPSLQRYLEAASGLTELTTTKAEQIAKQLVRSGEAAGDQVGELVEDMIERQRKNREAVTALVKSETVRAIRSMGLATTTEVERLQKQVADLKRELHRVERTAELGDDAVGGSGAKQSAKKAAKKASGKKAATKKAASKKATGKKASKKATGKKAAKKASGKTTSKKAGKKATKKSTGSSS